MDGQGDLAAFDSLKNTERVLDRISANALDNKLQLRLHRLSEVNQMIQHAVRRPIALPRERQPRQRAPNEQPVAALDDIRHGCPR
jgi:hypothetical protein